MAESLAVIGLASNILQFIETGAKLVSNFAEIHNSVSGQLSENLELEDAISDVEWAYQKLTASQDVAALRSDPLMKLVDPCLALAGDLKSTLTTLKLNRDKYRGIRSFVLAVTNFHKQAEIKEIQERVFRLRDQISAHLIVLLSERASKHATKKDVNQTNRQIEVLTAEVGKLTSEQPWKKGNEGSFGELVAKWQSFHKHNEYLCNARRVIKSLHYPKIMERRSAIVPAHQRTFDWMFSSQTTANFAAWLASGFTPDISESIYWVCGNAGSGKSTLMKHLAYHSQTRERLQTEGIIKRLVITSHYFWSCGTSMQASKEGLLKSILAQVFQQLPEVVPLISPSRFQDMGALEHWTEQELLDCIEATAVLDPPVCLCLFVDGLDECSEDHVALLDLLRRLAGSLHTKLCVSSRPWIDFITAFKNSSWKLLLQDLTRADITLYVQEHLQAEPRFLHLERLDAAEAGTLAAEIVERAEGVFLWVFLVIRSLKRGLRNGDGMRDLHRRLSQMPSDLKDFFRQMLENIEELYAERTARTFQVMVLAGRTLPLLLFWFMDEEEFDPFYSLNMRVGPYSMDLILTFVADKKMQLIAQCKDLIIIHEQPDEPDFCAMQVGFLHRTVADYFQTSAIYELLKTRAGPMFDPRRTYCKAGLAQLKMMAKWPPSTAADLERVQLIWEDMQEFGEQIKLLGGVIEPPEINRARKLISGKRFRIL